jgi:hypothetical protein
MKISEIHIQKFMKTHRHLEDDFETALNAIMLERAYLRMYNQSMSMAECALFRETFRFGFYTAKYLDNIPKPANEGQNK